MKVLLAHNGHVNNYKIQLLALTPDHFLLFIQEKSLQSHNNNWRQCESEAYI